MKQVMEQYAATLFVVMTGIVITLIFAGIQIQDAQGISNVLGNAIEKEAANLEPVFGGGAFDQYKNVAAPVIGVKNIYAIEAGKRIMSEECFVAMDYHDEILFVQVKEGWKEDGTPIELNLAEDGSFCVENAGLYWLSACAEDRQGYRREILVKCVVNERSKK